jgi:Uncharacterized protein conserved in bacteria (DUF2252)
MDIGDIGEATRSYEAWLRRHVPVIASELRDKHAQMRKDPFVFLRGTFYRWVQCWGTLDAAVRRAPTVVAVGDLHVESFGTWRDAEGRLCWGVDDFDDAYPLPYINDLVRLATSVKIAGDVGNLRLGFREGCDAILEAYATTMRALGSPIILAEDDERMDKLGLSELKPPTHFWDKLEAKPGPRPPAPPSALRALRALLPDRHLHIRVVHRVAGTGSLGQPRYAAIAEWDGGRIAREAKALVPSSCVWAKGDRQRAQPYYERLLRDSIRSPDPFQRVVGAWIVRRLSPDSNPIYLADLPAKRDETVLLGAMGTEVANVHLGTPRQRARILADLRRRPARWLRDAAKTMAKVVEHEWQEYRAL